MRSAQLFIFIFALSGLAACTTQQVDPTADIPTQSYQTDVAPIISANCALASGCHGAGSGEQAPLLTYTDLMQYCDVKAGKPHDSKLYRVIRQLSGESAMPPKPNASLSDEQIAIIYVWILQGARNN